MALLQNLRKQVKNKKVMNQSITMLRINQSSRMKRLKKLSK